MISNVRHYAFWMECTNCRSVSSPSIILAQKNTVPAVPPYAQINTQSVCVCMPAGAQKRIYLNWVISMISTICYYLSTEVPYPRALHPQWDFCMASTAGAKGVCLQRVKTETDMRNTKQKGITVITTWFKRLNNIRFQIIMIKHFTSFEDIMLVNSSAGFRTFFSQTLNTLLVHNEMKYILSNNVYILD